VAIVSLNFSIVRRVRDPEEIVDMTADEWFAAQHLPPVRALTPEAIAGRQRQPASIEEAAALLKCTDRCRREIQAALAIEDRWLRISYGFHPDLRDWSWSAQSEWVGWKNQREVRGPRWEAFVEAAYWAHFVPLEVAAGPFSYRALKREWPRGTRAILHYRVAEHWVPKLCAPREMLHSKKYGFISDKHRVAHALSSRRPGRVARTRLRKQCHLCGGKEDLTLHHVLGRQYGGATEPENLVCLCGACHDRVEVDRSLLFSKP
jgi:5-methylcytosine-specific restriction endonuclease McrA